MATLEMVIALIDQLSAEERQQLKAYLSEQEPDISEAQQILDDFKTSWEEAQSGQVLTVAEMWAAVDSDNDRV